MKGLAQLDQSSASVLMARYGITRVPADQYHYRKYRYSYLGDAIAQAERDIRFPEPGKTARDRRSLRHFAHHPTSFR